MAKNLSYRSLIGAKLVLALFYRPQSFANHIKKSKRFSQNRLQENYKIHDSELFPSSLVTS
jgi:hypothetical protein